MALPIAAVVCGLLQVVSSRPLDPDTYETRVLARAATLEAAREARRAAESEVDLAETHRIPRLEVFARGVLLSETESAALGRLLAAPPETPPGPLAPGTPLSNVPIRLGASPDTAWSVGARVGVPLVDHLVRFPAVSRAARAGATAAEAAEARALADRRLEAALEFAAFVDARARSEVARQALELLEAHRVDAVTRERLGVGTAADRTAVDAALAVAEVDRLRAAHGATMAMDRLRIALGDPVGTTYTPVPGPDRMPPTVDDAAALRARPELAMLRARVEAEGALGDVARASLWPRLDAFGEVTLARPGDRSFPPSETAEPAWQAGLVLSYTLSDGLEGEATMRLRAARRAEAEAEQRALDESLSLQISRARQAVREADATRAARSTSVMAAEEALRVRIALASAGTATATERLTAEMAVTSARFAQVEAETAVRTARARLLHALAGP
jgi:outer membrane protein TolC